MVLVSIPLGVPRVIPTQSSYLVPPSHTRCAYGGRQQYSFQWRVNGGTGVGVDRIVTRSIIKY